MNLKGNYIQLTKAKGVAYKDLPLTWTIPFSDELTISTSQITRQPIKDFFEKISQIAKDVAGSGLAGIAVSAAETLTDLFGVKFFAKKYYASSWTGEKPYEISVKLNFFRGMNNTWKAYEEVFTPIMQIMANTIPNDRTDTGSPGSGKMTAPFQGSLQAFLSFGESVLTDTLASLGDAVTSLGTFLAGDSGAKGKAAKYASTTETSLTDKAIGGYWTLNLGYMGDKDFTSYISLTNLICTNSSFTFSKSLEQSTPTSYSPIAGTLNLTFQSNTIMTTSDIPIPGFGTEISKGNPTTVAEIEKISKQSYDIGGSK